MAIFPVIFYRSRIGIKKRFTRVGYCHLPDYHQNYKDFMQKCISNSTMIMEVSYTYCTPHVKPYLLPVIVVSTPFDGDDSVGQSGTKTNKNEKL